MSKEQVKIDDNKDQNKTGEWIKGTAPIVLDIDESCIVHARTTKVIEGKEVKSQVMDYKYIINQGPAKHKFTITATDDGIASIIPEGEIEVNEGESITFNMNGYDGYRPIIDNIDNIKINASGVSSYIFEDVNTNHSISITNSSSVVKSSIVTPHAYEGGSISPHSRTEIPLNTPTKFRVIPNEGYEIDKVLIDGHNIGAVSDYTFTFTELEFHLIEAFFKEAAPATTYTITVSSNIGDTKKYTVNAGESYILQFTQNKNYHLTSVLDNNVEVISQVVNHHYTIASVNEDHIIVLTYESDTPTTTYTVTSSCNEGGTIDPSGESIVNEGESYTLKISPNEGYVIGKVLDNEVDVTDQVDSNKYAIKNINEDHTIVVAFNLK